MADRCVFWLLLALLPLALGQDESECTYGYLPYYITTPNWPDCLIDRLTNRLNGTYYIRPEHSENTSCPEEPCFTFTQLRDRFFVPNDLYNETIPNGDTSLVFLPGNHSFQLDVGIDLDFIRVGQYTTISLSGYSRVQPAIINCKNNSGPFFSAFESITISDLWFRSCVIYAWRIEGLLVNNVVFDAALLDVRFAASVVVSSSNIVLGSQAYCSRIDRYGMFHSNASQVDIQNVTFSSYNSLCDNPKLVNANGGYLDITDSSFSGRALQMLLSNTVLNMSGTVRFENGNNAILTLSSTVNLAGNISFINNTGYRGGAISLTDSSISIADNAYVVFQGNHADYVGGAIFGSGSEISIYVSNDQTSGQHLLYPCQTRYGANSRVEYINNTAESGGSAMYGITVSKLVCADGYGEYNTLFDILSFEPDDISAVSSDSLRVCICPDQSTPDCLAILPGQNIPNLHYTVYPGQIFTIPTAVVGFNFALTSGSVYAQFLNSNASLGLESQYIQEDDHTGCSLLQYSVLSDRINENETLVLTANRRRLTRAPSDILRDVQVLNDNEGYMFFDQTMYNYFPNPDKYYSGRGYFAMNQTDGVFRIAGHVPRPLQDVAVFVSLTILECPPGFTLFNRQCVCSEIILKSDLICNINDQTIRREGTTWINATCSESSGVIVHKHCPIGFCKREPVDVDLNNPDTQCTFNRSGTLCGACKPSFSLALGSNHCLPNCSNIYLSLLIPFALAGIVLVLFIKILNLTVSQGTINGLIFYANIVAANQSTFFPTQQSNLYFLSVFISWLNLDLGIETCFINGLNGYWKIWLQFVFPFYVWAIAGAIIVASQYSTRITKIFGTNSFSVLATLFFLSYSKLLRVIVTIFSSTTLDDRASTVWVFDGNILYFSAKRIPLFLFALVIVLLLWLPYTSVLLFAQWLRTKTHRKGLRWLKPFLDAYYGPFKDKHHYWVGVLLLVRGVLYIVFAFFFAVEDNVNLLLIILSSFTLAAYPSITGRLYKKIYLSALENSCFLNLGVLAAGTLYIRLVGGSQESLVSISIVIVLLQFLGLVAFHFFYFVIVPLKAKIKEWKIKASQSRDQFTNYQLLNIPHIFKYENVVTTEVRLSELEPASDNPDNNLDQHTSTAKEISFSTHSNTDAENTTDASANEIRSSIKKSEAPRVSRNKSLSQNEGYEPPKYLAAKKSTSRIDSTLQ